MCTYSVPDGVLNGGVGTIGCIDGSTEPGGSVKFNLFFDILLISLVFNIDFTQQTLCTVDLSQFLVKINND